VPAGVTAGLAAYEHIAPTVATILGTDYEALGVLAGTEYVLQQAVISAPGSRALTLELDASEQVRIVTVTGAALGDSLDLRLDGATASPTGPLADTTEWSAGFFVPAGASHSVTVDLGVEPGPKQKFSVVIWEARS
jgi:hypothetical protein